MKRYFRSDDHHGHTNILTYEADARPFPDVDAMFDAFRDRHNARVDPVDQVWHLGDVAFREEWVQRYLDEFNGHHTLVSGNHDPTFQRRSKAARARRRYLAMGFVDVVDGAELVLSDGTPVLLNHFPYYGDHTTDERYAELRPRDDGGWLLCGHIHSMWKTLDRMVNVGVDVWDLNPVAEDEIVAIIAAAP